MGWSASSATRAGRAYTFSAAGFTNATSGSPSGSRPIAGGTRAPPGRPRPRRLRPLARRQGLARLSSLACATRPTGGSASTACAAPLRRTPPARAPADLRSRGRARGRRGQPRLGADAERRLARPSAPPGRAGRARAALPHARRSRRASRCIVCAFYLGRRRRRAWQVARRAARRARRARPRSRGSTSRRPRSAGPAAGAALVGRGALLRPARPARPRASSCARSQLPRASRRRRRRRSSWRSPAWTRHASSRARPATCCSGGTARSLRRRSPPGCRSASRTARARRVARSSPTPLFRPLAPPRALPPAGSARRAGELVRAHGSDTLAFFKLRRDKQLPLRADRRAFVGYRIEDGVLLVSGDPVGPADALPGLARETSRFAERRGLRLGAVGASERLARRSAATPACARSTSATRRSSRPRSFSLEGRAIRKVRQSVTPARGGRLHGRAAAPRPSSTPPTRAELEARLGTRGATAPPSAASRWRWTRCAATTSRTARRPRARRRRRASAASSTSSRATAARRCRSRSCAATATRRTA